jgi:hypothetical protein
MPSPGYPADSENLIKAAQAARVLAHVRVMLSQLKSRTSKRLQKVL